MKNQLLAKEYLKKRGLKDPPLDSGISGGGDAPRQYTSLVMEDYAEYRYKKTNSERFNIIYESGVYFGYPKCCIREYAKDVIENIPLDHRISLISKDKGASLNGFIPCHQHCIEISTGLVKQEDLINNRICTQPFK